MKNKTMRALRYLGPEKLQVQNIPIPTPKAGEVLIKVSRVGICGSDIHGFLGLTGRRTPPMTLGHEFCGIVVQNGSESNKFKAGQRVVVQPINFCGYCENCKRGMTSMCLNKIFYGVLDTDGAAAEYIAVSEKLLYLIPDNASDDDMALTEPFAVGYGSTKKSGSVKDKTVMIIGAGAIGVCLLKILKTHNPAMIIMCDLSNKRLEQAKSFGADYVINPKSDDYLERIRKITGGKMLDITFEAVGVETTANQSIKSLKDGGVAIWVGMSQKEMTLNMQDIVTTSRCVLGSFNYSHSEFGEVAELIASGAIDTKGIVSKVISMEEAPGIFIDIHKNPDDYIKVLVNPTI